ncbi:phosphonate ABC transporter, permease protein PhnE [Paenibacillus sp. LMG 31456]|uniref:Phosphonate ABC transporter, permease protein PhnE n=1 Tax=Paenibacillus foliorum TaxID=2654974 RepID=A0A972JZH6_9BACL|nr:phosphonate ABC transporter, permease protein PhnE [Paenibacillus foliorum]NOU91853.1 phosphonate ABC transporter, permease protein PhnE [Paenibacillus foliorum]
MSSSERGPDSLKKPSSLKPMLSIILVLLLLGGSAYKTDASLIELIEGIPEMGKLFQDMYPPNWSYLSTIYEPMLETIRMAIIGTVIGSLGAIPISFLAARNVTRVPVLGVISRFILNLVRTIPDLMFAGVFAAIVGYGALAGAIALAFFSFGLVSKLTYESIESIDPGPLEAMTAVGANKLQWIHFGVVPQVMAQFAAYVLYTFEVNVRAAAILGFVGAGGIGLILQRSLDRLRYDQASTIILFTLVVVLLIDYVSTKLRERLL